MTLDTIVCLLVGTFVMGAICGHAFIPPRRRSALSEGNGTVNE